jgi:hypothetical protein
MGITSVNSWIWGQGESFMNVSLCTYVGCGIPSDPQYVVVWGGFGAGNFRVWRVAITLPDGKNWVPA